MSPVRFDSIHGHPAVILESEWLRVAVLPEKGADIYEIVYRPAGIDCLMKTPAGLKPPAAAPQGHFLDNYEGAWQELFPNANDACEYRGRAIPFHGEAALRPWQTRVLAAGGPATPAPRVEFTDGGPAADSGLATPAPRVEFTAGMRILPFRLTKTLALSPAEPLLEVTYTVENTGDEPLHYNWGEHIVVGAPFLERGCRFELPGGTIATLPVIIETATAILAPGQRTAWPYAETRDGRRVDLRRVPGPEAHTHDDCFIGDMPAGRLTVTNDRLNLAVDIAWDNAYYHYLAVWTPYGGSDAPPLTGIYGLGIEPYVSRYPLAEAVEQGEARLLAPGQREGTTLRLRFGPATGSAAGQRTRA
jgi:hypothetical protein